MSVNMNRFHFAAGVIAAILLFVNPARAQDGLIAHWKLAGDAKDHSGNENPGRSHGVDLCATGPDDKVGGAAGFDGLSNYIEVPHCKSLRFGTGNFSISVWVHTEKDLDDVIGDIVSKFDPAGRRGFNFSIQNYAGVTCAQSNYRHVHFGIDAGRIDPQWTDCGRPGNNLFVFALCVYQGQLYAGTFETGKDEAGHVYRYDGETRWIDCGSPDRCNSVQSLAVYDGRLYAGAGRYLSRGSALPDSPNEIPGGKVYRYEGGSRWIDCGKLQSEESGESFTVGGMAVYRGRFYAGVSKPPGRGLYRYEGETTWTSCGRLGTEKEVMGMAVYNGKLYAGTLPLAEVYRYEDGTTWTRTGQLDKTPDVRYRRAWSMAVYQGKLFCGTLPSGHVYSIEAGKSVSHDRALAPGWHHLAGVKANDRLKLYVDGTCVAESTVFDPSDYDLTTETPLKIGFGQHDYFNGRMKDLRIYDRALSEDDVELLYSPDP